MKVGEVGNGLQVLEEAMSVGHHVQGKAELLASPVQMIVDAEPLPIGAGENRPVTVAFKGSAVVHDLHDEGMDAATQNNDEKERIGSHQTSFPALTWGRTSAGESSSEPSCL